MKATKKIVGAAAALVAAVALSAGSTFAWFAANTEVSVTGMQVTTKVGSNLLIADATDTNKGWQTATGNAYSASLTQANTASIVKPASTIDGVNFYKTENASTDGKALTDSSGTASGTKYYTIVATSQTTYSSALSGKLYKSDDSEVTYTKDATSYEENTSLTNSYTIVATEVTSGVYSSSDTSTTYYSYDSTSDKYTKAALTDGYSFTTYSTATQPTTVSSTSEVYYVDYSFVLQAINKEASSAQHVSLTSASIIYKGTATDIQKAWRIAVFSENLGAAVNSGSSISALAKNNLISILTPVDAKTTNDAAKKLYFESGKAVSGTNKLEEVTNLNEAVDLCGTTGVAAGKTNFYAVTVRIWLEGEDQTCTTQMFADLVKDSWSVDLTFELETSSTAITYYAQSESSGSSGSEGESSGT